MAGQTKDAGFQLGVRKTFQGNQVDVWNFLISNEGIRIWLGLIEPDHLIPGQPFTLNSGIEGEITVLKLQSHLRMKFRKKKWKNTSRLQLRVIPTGRNKTIVAFHQEKLQGPEQREQMKRHWNKVIFRLELALSDRH